MVPIVKKTHNSATSLVTIKYMMRFMLIALVLFSRSHVHVAPTAAIHQPQFVKKTTAHESMTALGTIKI
jgi:hypothetical protein